MVAVAAMTEPKLEAAGSGVIDNADDASTSLSEFTIV